MNIYANYVIDVVNKAADSSKTNYRGHVNRPHHFGYFNVSIGDLKELHGTKALEWVAEFGKGAKFAKPAVKRNGRENSFYPARARKNGTASSCATIEGYITTYRMIVEQAMREKLISDHVFKNLEVPESALEEGEKAVIPPAVWSAFIESARERDNMLFVYSTLMKGLGTRPSEARAMRWDCVNLTTGVVNVKWTVKHGKEGMANLKVTKENSIKRKKGHKRVKRMNNLLPHELEVLKLYKAEQTAELGKCDFLFMKDGDIVTKKLLQ